MQEEVSKHARKIQSIAKSKQTSFSHKIKDILIEIFIIVFAVSLSIYLHGWNEHRKEQKEVKLFLANLREDLKKDLKSFEGDLKLYHDVSSVYKKLLAFNDKQLDSMDAGGVKERFPFNGFANKYSNATFEGFKSSGKLGLLENEKLKKMIALYYYNYSQSVLEVDKLYNENTNNANEVYMRMAGKSYKETYLNPEIRMRLKFLIFLSDNNTFVYKEYAIKEAKNIIKEIDKELSK